MDTSPPLRGGLVELSCQRLEVTLAGQGVGAAIGGAHGLLHQAGDLLRQVALRVADLVELAARDDQVRKAFAALLSALAPSSTQRIGFVTQSPRSRSPTNRSVTRVELSVSSSTTPKGCCTPSASMPTATTRK